MGIETGPNKTTWNGYDRGTKHSGLGTDPCIALGKKKIAVIDFWPPKSW